MAVSRGSYASSPMYHSVSCSMLIAGFLSCFVPILCVFVLASLHVVLVALILYVRLVVLGPQVFIFDLFHHHFVFLVQCCLYLLCCQHGASAQSQCVQVRGDASVQCSTHLGIYGQYESVHLQCFSVVVMLRSQGF